VFVDVGDSVTGLLHRSELDQRLESLDWESGDTVFVQVQQVRDNGNVDLSWSIRQSEDEFRGTLVDDPDQGAPFVADEEDEEGNGHGTDATDEAGGGQSAGEAPSRDPVESATGGEQSPEETATAGAVTAADQRTTRVRINPDCPHSPFPIPPMIRSE
jgi:hypothetical protein